MSFIRWFGAWFLFILLLVIFARTAAGKTIVYYLLWLAVAVLIVTHADEISGLFSAAGITPAASTQATA